MNYKKSFTLSEIMIAMAIFGIIAAACIPIVMNMSPNKHAIMIKKAYYTIEQIVSDLVNDPIYFPDGDLSNTDPFTIGNISITNGDAKKFRCLFTSKLNLKDSSALASICTINEKYLAETTNGLVFHLGNCPFNSDWHNANACRIDVSTETDVTNSKYMYDTNMSCIDNANGWGGNDCLVNGNTGKVNLIAKFAVKISRDGGITLVDGQNHVADIINGQTSLLGK